MIMSLESIYSVFSGLFYFAIVLGLAVIFHEWGHFIVAKLAGAKVDQFAVGFGRKLFKFDWHGTEYSIRLLPLGGLVKIRGMDPDDEITGAEFEYLQLAPWKRILIVVAGPFMNFVLAYLLYVFVLFSFGQAYTGTTTVGYVPHGSWGWEIGLRDGDRLISINGQPIASWEDVNRAISNVRGGLVDPDSSIAHIELEIERDGKIITKKKDISDDYISALTREISKPDTEIPRADNGIYVSYVMPKGAAANAGLTSNVVITSINGITFTDRQEWSDYISSSYEQLPDGSYRAKPLTIAYVSTKGESTLTVTPNLVIPAEDAIPNKPNAQLGLLFEGEISVIDFFTPSTALLGVSPKLQPVVGHVQDGSAADKAGITKDCRIVEINGKEVDDWVDVLHAIHSASVSEHNGVWTAEPLEITWLTPKNEIKQATVTPEVTMQNILTPTSVKTGKRYPIAQIGLARKSERIQIGALGAITGGWQRVESVCGFMFDFLGKLFTGNISPKLLGGPIAIYQLSSESGRWGLEKFFEFIALLSINLAILNLFPFPPFDGGHAVVYLVEMVRMKPITMKQMETFGKIGFALVIPLFIYLIFNDLNRNDFFNKILKIFF